MTACPRGGWTFETLHSHFAAIIEQHDRRYTDRFTAQAESLRLAGEAARAALEASKEADERRFELLNELRKIVQDIQSAQMPRSECVLRLETVESRLAATESARRGMHTGWIYFTAAIGAIGGVAAIVATIYAIGAQ